MSEFEPLYQLARLYGIKTAYFDLAGHRREATPRALLAALRALGAPVGGAADCAGAIRERRAGWWQDLCEPVIVVWQGEPAEARLRLPVRGPAGKGECRLQLEDGRLWCWEFATGDLAPAGGETVEGTAYELRRLALPGDLPPGYHRMTLDLPVGKAEVLVIAAPAQAYALAPDERVWGVFLPLYALHSGRSGVAGDLSDLEALLEWVGELGGHMAGTLPLLPAFMDRPFDPSPYAPVSRLFWNEFYLDLERVAEVRREPEIRALLADPEYRREIAALKAEPLVDYRRGMVVKRRVLEAAARLLYAAGGGRLEALRGWAGDHPRARDYARFRAATEQQGAPWGAWPARMRDGQLQDGDYDSEAARYHLYVQWLLDGQLGAISQKARQKGPKLYLDLPLGVHGDGYDMWRERAAFVPGMDTGAPPDPFNMDGQNWGFAPPHPENIRTEGYRYYIACLRHHLRMAGVLRIDHAAGLRRLFWIPQGLPAREGIYVRYRQEEFFAILALESHRHQALIVGEDLGTVPDALRQTMARRRVYGMYVAPFELSGDSRAVLNPVRREALACLNTHDMVPWAAFWKKREPAAAALPDYLHRRGRLETPTGETGAVLEGLLADLAAGPAGILQVNLEDLWLEDQPQNIPGTSTEYPNWRRKARYSLDEFSRMDGVNRVLRKVDDLRKGPI